MAIDDLSDDEFIVIVNKTVGAVLKQARTEKGWTREEMRQAMRLVRARSVQTVFNQETGIRSMMVAQFIDRCWALGVSPPDMLQQVVQRVDLELAGITVDLLGMVRNANLVALRRWAETQLAHNPDMHMVWLSPSRIQDMAALAGFTPDEIHQRLAPFTAPPRTDKHYE